MEIKLFKKLLKERYYEIINEEAGIDVLPDKTIIASDGSEYTFRECSYYDIIQGGEICGQASKQINT
jgi:hypothetical protein